jgi:hypothetical protein
MRSLTEVREELADLLRAINGLRAYAYNPDAGALHFPAIVVMDATPEYNRTFGAGLTTVRFRLALSVGGQVSRSTQEKLDAYLANSGDQSIRQALEDAGDYETFDDLSVEGVVVVGFEDVAEMGFYGAVLTVRLDITTEQP